MDFIKLLEYVPHGTYSDFLNFIKITENKEFDFLEQAALFLLNQTPKITLPFDAIDICGTGGDAASLKTTNVSTISSFVLASMGIPVAKHGGRGVSSESGSVDFLSHIGIKEYEHIYSIKKYNICFLDARKHHNYFKHIAPFRKEYGKKTIFNMLGPIINPATITSQMVGVSFSGLEKYATILQKLGRKSFAVVQSKSGADELLSFEENTAWMGNGNELHQTVISPRTFGMPSNVDDSILGKTPQENVRNALNFFEKPKENTLLYTVALNAGFASTIFGKTDKIIHGIEYAREVIFSKKPLDLIHSMQKNT